MGYEGVLWDPRTRRVRVSSPVQHAPHVIARAGAELWVEDAGEHEESVAGELLHLVRAEGWDLVTRIGHVDTQHTAPRRRADGWPRACVGDTAAGHVRADVRCFVRSLLACTATDARGYT